jgi:hypothetical protein
VPKPIDLGTIVPNSIATRDEHGARPQMRPSQYCVSKRPLHLLSAASELQREKSGLAANKRDVRPVFRAPNRAEDGPPRPRKQARPVVPGEQVVDLRKSSSFV